MSKILWYDCETTGLDSKKHAIIQLACLFEVNGKVEEEMNLFARPWKGDLIDDKALEVNKRTRKEIEEFEHPAFLHQSLMDTMKKYVNPYDREDKFIGAGFYVNFDNQFLRQFFWKRGDKYFGSWFHAPLLDVSTLVALWVAREGIVLESFSLSTLCEHFSIELRAHDALEDIKATRELYIRLWGALVV